MTDYDRSNPVTSEEASKRFLKTLEHLNINDVRKREIMNNQIQMVDNNVLELLQQYGQLRSLEDRIDRLEGKTTNDTRFKKRSNIMKYTGKAKLIKTKTLMSKVMPAKGIYNIVDTSKSLKVKVKPNLE